MLISPQAFSVFHYLTFMFLYCGLKSSIIVVALDFAILFIMQMMASLLFLFLFSLFLWPLA